MKGGGIQGRETKWKGREGDQGTGKEGKDGRGRGKTQGGKGDGEDRENEGWGVNEASVNRCKAEEGLFYVFLPKSVYNKHDPIGRHYLYQAKTGMSPLRCHKFRHNFQDTPDMIDTYRPRGLLGRLCDVWENLLVIY